MAKRRMRLVVAAGIIQGAIIAMPAAAADQVCVANTASFDTNLSGTYTKTQDDFPPPEGQFPLYTKDLCFPPEDLAESNSDVSLFVWPDVGNNGLWVFTNDLVPSGLFGFCGASPSALTPTDCGPLWQVFNPEAQGGNGGYEQQPQMTVTAGACPPVDCPSLEWRYASEGGIAACEGTYDENLGDGVYRNSATGSYLYYNEGEKIWVCSPNFTDKCSSSVNAFLDQVGPPAVGPGEHATLDSTQFDTSQFAPGPSVKLTCALPNGPSWGSGWRSGILSEDDES